MSVEITTRGYIELWFNGQKLSQHRVETEALESLLNHFDALEGDGSYELRFPRKDVVARKLKIVPIPKQPQNNEPPSAPLLSGVKGDTGVVSLSWSAATPATGTTVASYNVYRNGALVESGNTTRTASYTGLDETIAHVFQVTAVSNFGAESTTSNQFGVSWAYWSDGLPSSYNLQENAPFSYTFEATEPAGNPIVFNYDSGALPANLEVLTPDQVGTTRELTIRSLTGLTPPDSYAVSVLLADSTATGDLPILSVSSATGAWTFGQPIKKQAAEWLRAVDPNTDAALPNVQVEIRNRWSDNSAKFAVISGWNTGAVKLAPATSNPYTATALTQAAMVAAISSCSITVGAQTVDVKVMLSGTPHRTVATGPVCSNWIFRQTLTVGTDMSLWVDVRYYSNGAVEVFPWVENGYLLTVQPPNYVGTCSVTVGGATTSLGSIDFKHRTRVPLLKSTGDAYWVNQSADLTPSHNVAYIKATKLVPNYGIAPSSAMLASAPTTYTPNRVRFDMYQITEGMGVTGNAGSFMVPPSAQYLSSGDGRAYKAALLLGYSSGAWSIHFRESPSGLNPSEPIRFTDYPNIASNGSPQPWYLTASMPQTNGNAAFTHLPGFAYLPYLVTGRWWFLDELLFWSTWGYMIISNPYEATGGRFRADGILNPNTSIGQRGSAWGLYTLACATNLLPEGHPCRAAYIASWEANCTFFRTAFVDGGAYKGTNFGTSWVSPQGTLGIYSSGGGSSYTPPGDTNSWVDAGFAQNYMTGSWAATSDFGLPVSEQAQQNHLAIRNHAYNFVVKRSVNDYGWNWRRFTVFDYPLGSDASGVPPETMYTHAQAYPLHCTHWSIDPALPNTTGLSLKLHATSERQDLDSGETGDLHAGASSMPYFASGYAALCMAKDHGFAMADAGYLNITGASNFASLSSYWTDSAQGQCFAVVPR